MRWSFDPVGETSEPIVTGPNQIPSSSQENRHDSRQEVVAEPEGNPMMPATKSRASGLSGGQEFDDAEPVLLILPIRLEIVFVLCSQDRQILFPEFWLKTRDTQTIHRASVPWYPSCYLQGITVGLVPCNYYVIRQNIALSRRSPVAKSSIAWRMIGVCDESLAILRPATASFGHKANRGPIRIPSTHTRTA
jgi:hypothetical protein